MLKAVGGDEVVDIISEGTPSSRLPYSHLLSDALLHGGLSSC